jgi:ubiquinone/menaquinone biosynthesis C-methylase UbiE
VAVAEGVERLQQDDQRLLLDVDDPQAAGSDRRRVQQPDPPHRIGLADSGRESRLLSFGRLTALHRRIVELAGITPGERILDVGCGPGRLAILGGRVAGPSGEACGIDPAPEMIELARRNAARAHVPTRFEVGVIEALPYPDHRFDVVSSSLMLHHLPEDLKRRGLAEVRRVLKPAGPTEGIGHLLCVLRLRTGWDHAERLSEMLRRAGFDAVEFGPTGHRGLAFVRGQKPIVGSTVAGAPSD